MRENVEFERPSLLGYGWWYSAGGGTQPPAFAEGRATKIPMPNEPLPQPAPITELPNLFREEAARAQPYAPKAAGLWRRAADWLEISLAAHLDEIIPVARAATEAGWSYEALRRRVSHDASINAGIPGAPAIRRSDLSRLGPPRGKRQKRASQKTAKAVEGAVPPSHPFDRVLARVHSTMGGAP